MPLYEIDVAFDGVDSDSLADIVKEAAATTLEELGVTSPASISVLLSGDDKLRELNHRFRGQDYPTDVLSFPMDTIVPGLDGHLGDIAISLESCQKQALRAGHSTNAELQLLVVHGVLHLLGYDHMEQREMEQMWSIQSNILRKLNREI